MYTENDQTALIMNYGYQQETYWYMANSEIAWPIQSNSNKPQAEKEGRTTGNKCIANKHVMVSE